MQDSADRRKVYQEEGIILSLYIIVMASQDSFSTGFHDNRSEAESAADVFGASEELRRDMGPDAEFDERCAQIIDQLIGPDRTKSVLKLLSANVVAGVEGLAQAVRDQDPEFEALVNAVADVAKIPSGFFEEGEVGDRSSSAETPWGGMRRKRGGGPEQEEIDRAEQEAEGLVNAVANVVEGGNEGQALEQAAVRIAGPAAVAIQGAAGNSPLASAGLQVNPVISVASQSVAGGLSCLAGAAGTTSRAVIRAIRRATTAAGASVYQVRQRVASFTAGIVALGTWAAGYWAPGSVGRSVCMTVLTPFMTRYGAGPWCGVEVQAPGMFHAAQQFAASLAPGGAFWETLGIFGIATTERYDTAARAVFVTVSALIVIGFGSWPGFIGTIGRSTRRAAARALGGLNRFFTGAVTAQDALQAQFRSTYAMLVNTWTERGGRINEEDSFQACLAIAVALGANPEQLMAGGSAFGGLARYGPSAEVVNAGRPQQEQIQEARLIGLQNDFGPNQTPGGLGFSLSVGGVDAPGHSPTSLPNELQNEPRLMNVIEALLTNADVARSISNLPAPPADLADPARAKYMQLRSLLQLAAVTAGALTRARAGPESMSDATQQALQEQLQRIMETYRDMRINSLLAAEDLAVAFATNVGGAIMQDQPAPGQQGGGRRRRRTRRNKPRSRARRKENKRKTRLGKHRRTRRH